MKPCEGFLSNWVNGQFTDVVYEQLLSDDPPVTNGPYRVQTTDLLLISRTF